MCAGPIETAALKTLREVPVFLCHVRRHAGYCPFARDRHQSFIAVRTAIAALITHAEIDLKVPVELAELIVEVITDDQRMAAAEHFAFCQVSIASQEPPILPEHTLDQRLIRDDLLVGRIVAEDAQPTCEAAEHGIGKERKERRRLNGAIGHGRLYPSEKWRPAPAVSNRRLSSADTILQCFQQTQRQIVLVREIR